MTKLKKKIRCDKTNKNQIVTKLIILNCDKTHKLKCVKKNHKLKI